MEDFKSDLDPSLLHLEYPPVLNNESPIDNLTFCLFESPSRFLNGRGSGDGLSNRQKEVLFPSYFLKP